MDSQVFKPIFCDLPNSDGELVPHIIHLDYQYYLPSKNPEGQVYFNCKNDLCKAKVEVTYYKKNFPAKSKIPFKEDHELTSGEPHIPSQVEVIVAQTLRDIQAALKDNKQDKLKTVYAQCVNQAVRKLRLGTEEMTDFSTSMPKFIQLEMTMKTWKNNATPLNTSKDSLTVEDNNEVLVYDVPDQVQNQDDDDDNIQILEENGQIYPEPSSEETGSQTNDSEAQVITLCDPPIHYDSISSKIAASINRKKPRGRPRGRGRPKGSRNLPREIQVDNQANPGPSSEERESTIDNFEAQVITIDNPDEQSPEEWLERPEGSKNSPKETDQENTSHTYPEPFSEEIGTPIDNSEAHVITLDVPLPSNPVSFELETDEIDSKKRRGRPKASQNCPKEILINDSDEELEQSNQDEFFLEQILEKVPDTEQVSNQNNSTQEPQSDVDQIPHQNHESSEQRLKENELDQQNPTSVELNDSTSVKFSIKDLFINITRMEKCIANDCYDPDYWTGRLPESLVKCDICNKSFDSLAKLKTHCRQYGHMLPSQYKTSKRKSDQDTCQICNKTFKSNKGAVIHYKKVHVNNVNMSEQLPAQEEFTDADVDFVEYSGSEGVNDHNSEEVIELAKEDLSNEIMIDLPTDVNTSSAKSVECDEVVIDDDEDLVEISDTSNPTDQIFNTFTKAGVIKAPTFCAICRLGFPSRNFVLQHIADYHKFQPSYSCSDCKQSFAFYFQYNRHMIVSHESSLENRPYKIQCSCEVCGLKFDGQILYRKHRREAHENFAFKCDKCVCGYPERAVLMEHRRTKHGIPLNDVIDNTAMSIKAVEKSSVEKHKCDRCDALFLTPDQLIIHKTSHLVSISKQPINQPKNVIDSTAYSVLNVIRTGQGEGSNNSESNPPRRVSVDDQELPMINVVLPRRTNNSPSTTKSLGLIVLEAKDSSSDEDIEMLEDPTFNVNGDKPEKAKVRKNKAKTRKIEAQTSSNKKQMPSLLPLTKNSVFVEKPFACDICPESFSQKIVLSMHKQLNHSQANPIFSTGSPDKNKTVQLKTVIAPQIVPKNKVMIQPNGDVIVTSNANVMMTSNPNVMTSNPNVMMTSNPNVIMTSNHNGMMTSNHNIMMTSNGMISSNSLISSDYILSPNNMMTLNDPEMISNSAPEMIVGDDSDTFLYTREQLEADDDNFHDDIAEHYQDDIAAADDDILILEDDDNHNQEMGIQDMNGETGFEEERMDIKDENIDIHHTPIIDHVDSILSI